MEETKSPKKRITKKYPSITPFAGMEYETSEESSE